MKIHVKLPLDREIIVGLKAGDRVLLTGFLFTARDAAHKKMFELINAGEKLPIDIAGETIYYAGPCPAFPGRVIGSAGPTTSGRMDRYAPLLIEHGLVGMIGKGDRDEGVIATIIKNKAIYFGATGGAGALISERIKSVEKIAFPELGTEAIRKLYVENFPAIVLIDSSGRNLYKMNTEKYRIELNK